MKLSTLVCSLAALASAPIVLAAPPGQVPAAGNAGKSAADAAWDTLVSSAEQNPPTDAQGSFVASLVSAADQFAAFATQNPGHAKNKEAKAWEAIMLGRAAIAGDNAHEGRRTAALAQARNDKTIAPSVRAELIATSDTVGIVRAKLANHDAMLAAYETSSRGLIAEFPGLPNGYESLLAIARDSSDAHGGALAAEVASLAGAPDWVKTQAAKVAARFALVGQPIPAGVTAAAGKATVYYSWSARDAASRLRANACAAKAPASVAFVGICLDTGIAEAQAQAAADHLPGTQIFDEKGSAGAAARALSLTEPGFIYGADRTGTIRSVALQNDLGAAFLASNP